MSARPATITTISCSLLLRHGCSLVSNNRIRCHPKSCGVRMRRARCPAAALDALIRSSSSLVCHVCRKHAVLLLLLLLLLLMLFLAARRALRTAATDACNVLSTFLDSHHCTSSFIITVVFVCSSVDKWQMMKSENKSK